MLVFRMTSFLIYTCKVEDLSAHPSFPDRRKGDISCSPLDPVGRGLGQESIAPDRFGSSCNLLSLLFQPCALRFSINSQRREILMCLYTERIFVRTPTCRGSLPL